MRKKEINRRINLFKKYILYYQNKLNLNHFEITITEQIKENARASCYDNISGYIATICYSLDWINDEKLTDSEIEIVAKHECIELLFAEIRHYLLSFYSESIISEITHKVIRVLEKLI